MFGVAARTIPRIGPTGLEQNFSIGFVTALAAGNNTVRTPAAGRTLRIYKIAGSVSAAVNLTFTDGNGGTVIAAIGFAAAGSFSIDFTDDEANGVDLTPGNALVCTSTGVANPFWTVAGREG